MATELEPYPTYKDSGVPWLVQVPEQWDIKCNKRFLREVNQRSEDGTEELLTVSQYTGVTRRRERSLGEGDLLTHATSLVGHKRVSPGDLVVNIMLAWNGSLGVSSLAGIVSPAYCVYRAGPQSEPRFLHYLYRTPLFTGAFKTVSTGVVDSRLRLYPDVFFDMSSLLPPLPEQTAIVRYLDHADRKVRHAIHARQQLIKLLTEQKQAIIQRAVMRGLDPSVRLKPSGVLWLGDVPEHWTVVRLRHLLACPLINGLFKKKDSYGSGVPLVNVTDIYQDDFTIVCSTLDLVAANADEVRTFRVQPGDILFVRSSLKLEGTGQSALVSKCDESTVFECHLVRARPNQLRVSSRFLTLFLNSPSARSSLVAHANTVTMSTLPQGAMKSISVPVPPLCEQEAILAAVDRDTASVMRAIDTSHREIDLLRQYRTRLIADVVTGKLDVRGVKVPDDETDVLSEELESIDDVDAADQGDDTAEGNSESSAEENA